MPTALHRAFHGPALNARNDGVDVQIEEFHVFASCSPALDVEQDLPKIIRPWIVEQTLLSTSAVSARSFAVSACSRLFLAAPLGRHGHRAGQDPWAGREHVPNRFGGLFY